MSWLYFGLATLASVMWASEAAAQDWPMPLGSARRTSRQSAPGEINEPAVRWSLPVGGGLGLDEWLAGDVDGDGSDEVLLLRGGRLLARTLDGTLLWGTAPLGLDSIRAISDMDSDGRQEVYASAPDVLVAVDLATGEVLWQTPREPRRTVGDAFPVGVDGHTALYVADRNPSFSGPSRGRFYHFDAPFPAPPRVVEIDTTDHGYWVGWTQALADLDGDTLPELVTLSHDEVVVYDVRTGRELWRMAVGAIPYAQGRTSAADIDDDGRDEVIVATNQPGRGETTTRRLLVVELEGSDLTVRWELRFDPNEGIHRSFAEVATTLVSGEVHLVTSYYEPGEERWHTLVFRGSATDATPLIDLPDRALSALVDVDSDGEYEVVTVDATALAVPAFGTLRFYALEGSRMVERFAVAASALLLERSPWGGTRMPVFVSLDGGLLIARDLDTDGRAEVVAVVDGSGIRIERELGVGRVAVSVRRLRAALLDETRFALSRSDGRIAAMTESLLLTNDTRPRDGQPDLYEPNLMSPSVAVAAGPDGERLLVLVAAEGTIEALRLDTTIAGETPEPLWTSTSRVAFSSSRSVQILPDRSGRVVWRSRGVDGSLDLVIADGLTGATLESVPISSSNYVRPLRDVTPIHGPDGQIERLIYAVHNLLDGIAQYWSWASSGVVALPSLTRLIECAYDRPVSTYESNGDGTEDLLLTQGNRVRVVDGRSGEVLRDESNTPCGGVLSVFDAAEDEVGFLQHEPLGVRRRTPDLEVVWEREIETRYRFAGLARTGDGSLAVGAPARDESVFTVFDIDDGSTIATTVLAGGRAYPDVVTALADEATLGALSDVVGVDELIDGQPHFLVGSTDGHLYAVRAEDGTLAWSLDFRAAVGAPIAADVDGDEGIELLVPVGDGHVHVVTQSWLLTPGPVFDTDGTFVAASAAEDLDTLSGQSVGANWQAVPDATNYAYQLVRDDELVVVPWTDVGEATRFVRDDLRLEVGRRYRTLVRAMSTSEVSAEASSDGFVVEEPEPEPDAGPHPQPVSWHAIGGGCDCGVGSTPHAPPVPWIIASVALAAGVLRGRRRTPG